MKIDLKKILKFGLPVFIGSVLGYAYYYFIGCNTGSCPITSNPYTTTIYGALIGAIWSFPTSKKDKKEVNESNN
ncbi:MAG: DUF6132 family protein [Melioribacteraceae bacterium]|nr:MAG: DUF6132 family protein [Melioribacteraceae bacterium]